MIKRLKERCWFALGIINFIKLQVHLFKMFIILDSIAHNPSFFYTFEDCKIKQRFCIRQYTIITSSFQGDEHILVI